MNIIVIISLFLLRYPQLLIIIIIIIIISFFFFKKRSCNFAVRASQLTGGIYRQNREFPGRARQGFAGLPSLNEFYVLTLYRLWVLFSGS